MTTSEKTSNKTQPKLKLHWQKMLMERPQITGNLCLIDNFSVTFRISQIITSDFWDVIIEKYKWVFIILGHRWMMWRSCLCFFGWPIVIQLKCHWFLTLSGTLFCSWPWTLTSQEGSKSKENFLVEVKWVSHCWSNNKQHSCLLWSHARATTVSMI